jgi:phosphoglycerate dehydrogenase-like enzyme
MLRILVEDDSYLRIVPVLLDPKITEEHRRALSDFMAHDEPDFEGWLHQLWQQVPGLYPARVELVTDQDDLRAKLPDADAVILESLKFGEAELALAPKLSIVQKFGTLVPNIDIVACAKKGVPVKVQKRRVNIAVAEQAFTLMIALARRLCETNGNVDVPALKAAGFDPTPYDRRYTTNSNYARIPQLKVLNGAVFGALGMGEIGREVAIRAAAFGMKVIYHQRNRMSIADEHMIGAEYVSLDRLLRESDFLSLHLPLNDATKGIIGKAEFQAMKRGAIVINIARAQLIDREALTEALSSGHLGGYGLDVGYEEPARPDEPLKQFRNVILTPHTAVAERQNGLLDMAEICKNIWHAVVERGKVQPLSRSA